MTTELAPLNLTEIQRKAREDLVCEISTDIYERIQSISAKHPATKTASLTIYADRYNNCDCLCQIQGLLHEELSGLFPETTISIRYSANNEWWRYALICCIPRWFIGDRLYIELSW